MDTFNAGDSAIERWTRLVLRLRWLVLAVWLAVLIAGGFASTRLSGLLSNDFGVPGTDSAQVQSTLQQRFGDRSDGEYLIVFEVARPADRTLLARLQRTVDRAALVIPTARAGPLRVVAQHVVEGTVFSQLDLARAKASTPALERALGQPRGEHAYVSGQAAIQHDLDPIFSQDLRRGEFAIAIPVALLVLLLVLGVSAIVSLPLIFAGTTIAATLGIVFLFAHVLPMATYVTNLVELIGLALAIDYSLLVVYRFREELAAGRGSDEAVVRTMATAGRSVVFSGATVAVGLALLLFIPVPFVRSLGIGGFLIPLVSIVAALTLLPALLSLNGRRGAARLRIADAVRGRLRLPLPRAAGTADIERGLWARYARSIMRRPLAYVTAGALVLTFAAVPAFGLRLTPGSADGIPRFPQSVQGFDLLRRVAGPGALSPNQLLVDAGPRGSVFRSDVQAAVARLEVQLRADPEVASIRPAPGAPLADPTGRYEELVVIGRHEYGSEDAQSLIGRLRRTIIPAARFPAGTRTLVGGGAAQGVDFLHRSYAAFPWLVLAVLGITYVLLMRAFRSLLLPLKAVLLNLLSVASSYGMLVVFFRWGVGRDLAGLYQFGQIEGWIPIFLFAMLFGLSMDYEVFLVTRMREAWDELHDNERAVAHGLEHTGRIVTAAAIIMVAAFSGFVAGRIAGLQEFGLGLAVAVFVDATVIRALLVPAIMALVGRYNWWLPTNVARLLGTPPSPLPRPATPALRASGE
ncbi:MAG TPA: MMPL family transporter [Gaiellaceae bacterium]|jgi:RND superfamily putative drug exporter